MPTPPSLEEVVRKALAPQYGARGSEALMTRWWNAMRRRPRHRMRAADRTYWRAQALLSDAVFYVDAARSTVSGGKLRNLGSGGSALDAQFGSTAPSAYFNGTALVLPGVAGNYASTPDAAALDITGDIEIVMRAALDDWTPAAQSALVSKLGGAGVRAYSFVLSPSGQLKFDWSTDGTTIPTASSTIALPAVNGTAYWVKMTRSTSGSVNFYYAADQATEPTSWTQLGTTVAGTAGAIFVNTNTLDVGGRGTVDPAAGKFYRAIVRNGIGGSAVFDADFAKPFDTTSFTATTGQTVTLARSTSGTDTNDPTLLPHTGTNYLYCPGVVGNYASTPDAAALDITGDIEMVVRAQLADWTPANFTTLVAKDTVVAGERSYSLRMDTGSTGRLYFEWFTDGTSATVATASPSGALPFTDGQTYWIRARFTASDRVLTVHYAADQPTEPTSWTLHGSSVSGASTSIFSGPAALTIGGRAADTPCTGGIYRTIIRNSIGGSAVFDADFTTGITSGGQTSFTATTGQTVTINRATSGRKAVAVTRPVVLLGTDDYFEVADNALLNFGLTDNFTAVAVIRQFGTPAANVPVLGKVNFALLPGGAGWQLYNNGTTTGAKMLVSDTTAFATAQSSVFPASGALNVMTGVRDVAADLLRTYNNGTASGTNTDVATATSSNTLPLRIGYGTGTGFNDMEFVAAAVFRRALTAAEIADIVNYYNTVT